MSTVTANVGKTDLTRDLIYGLDDNPARLTTPYPYQSRVIAETLSDLAAKGFHGLFLDMGTGKTLVTLYTYLQLLRCGMVDHLVVVAPKALLTTWKDELAKHVKGDTVGVTTWQSTGGKGYAKELAAFPDEAGRVFLVNVEAFQGKNGQLEQFLDNLLATRRVLMAVDESSKIKTPTAQRTKRLVMLAEAARYRLILTGTEITNSCLDLYAQFLFLERKFWQPLPTFYAFRYRYAVLETKYGPGGRSFQAVVGYQREDELLAKVAPHVSRVKKEDVLDLPPKRYQDVWLDMPAGLRAVYDELKAELSAEYAGQVLTVANAAVLFGRFRQLVGGYWPSVRARAYEGRHIDLKLNAKLSYLIEELEDTNEKAIVWACYREEIRLLTQSIPGARALFGEMHQEARDEAVTAFRADPACKVLVASPAVAAYGLNLQHCRLVYWYSNPLSPEQRWQGEDRCHRIGQTGSVLYKDLLYRNSVDERVKHLLAGKTQARNFFRDGMTVKDFLEVFE